MLFNFGWQLNKKKPSQKSGGKPSQKSGGSDIVDKYGGLTLDPTTGKMMPESEYNKQQQNDWFKIGKDLTVQKTTPPSGPLAQQLAQPSQPLQPSQPSQPSQQSTQPTQPTQPTQQSTQSTQSTQQSAQSTNGVNLSDYGYGTSAPSYPGEGYTGANLPKGNLFSPEGTNKVYENIPGEGVYHIPSSQALEAKYGKEGWGQVTPREMTYEESMSRLYQGAAEAGLSPTEAAALAMARKGGKQPGEEGYVKPMSERLKSAYKTAEEEAGIGKAKTKVQTASQELSNLDDKVTEKRSEMEDALEAISSSPYMTNSMISGKVNKMRRTYEQDLNNLISQRQNKANELELAQSGLNQARQNKWNRFENLSNLGQQAYQEETTREMLPYLRPFARSEQETAQQNFMQDYLLETLGSSGGGAGGGANDNTVGWSKYAAELGLVGQPYDEAMKQYGEYQRDRVQGLKSVDAGELDEDDFLTVMNMKYPGKANEIRKDLQDLEGGGTTITVDGQTITIGQGSGGETTKQQDESVWYNPFSWF